MEVVRAADRTRATGQTSGITREAAFEVPGAWVGWARTEPGAVSGWHHHDENETYFVVVRGRALVEWGSGGKDSVLLEPGDFIHIPPFVVHRESNPGTEESHLALFRHGRGPATVNVDAPGG